MKRHFSFNTHTHAWGGCDRCAAHRLSEGLRGGVGGGLHARLSYRGKTCPARLVYDERAQTERRYKNRCIEISFIWQRNTIKASKRTFLFIINGSVIILSQLAHFFLHFINIFSQLFLAEGKKLLKYSKLPE